MIEQEYLNRTLLNTKPKSNEEDELLNRANRFMNRPKREDVYNEIINSTPLPSLPDGDIRFAQIRSNAINQDGTPNYEIAEQFDNDFDKLRAVGYVNQIVDWSRSVSEGTGYVMDSLEEFWRMDAEAIKDYNASQIVMQRQGIIEEPTLMELPEYESQIDSEEEQAAWIWRFATGAGQFVRGAHRQLETWFPPAMLGNAMKEKIFGQPSDILDLQLEIEDKIGDEWNTLTEKQKNQIGRMLRFAAITENEALYNSAISAVYNNIQPNLTEKYSSKGVSIIGEWYQGDTLVDSEDTIEQSIGIALKDTPASTAETAGYATTSYITKMILAFKTAGALLPTGTLAVPVWASKAINAGNIFTVYDLMTAVSEDEIEDYTLQRAAKTWATGASISAAFSGAGYVLKKGLGVVYNAAGKASPLDQKLIHKTLKNAERELRAMDSSTFQKISGDTDEAKMFSYISSKIKSSESISKAAKKEYIAELNRLIMTPSATITMQNQSIPSISMNDKGTYAATIYNPVYKKSVFIGEYATERKAFNAVTEAMNSQNVTTSLPNKIISAGKLEAGQKYDNLVKVVKKNRNVISDNWKTLTDDKKKKLIDNSATLLEKIKANKTYVDKIRKLDIADGGTQEKLKIAYDIIDDKIEFGEYELVLNATRDIAKQTQKIVSKISPNTTAPTGIYGYSRDTQRAIKDFSVVVDSISGRRLTDTSILNLNKLETTLKSLSESVKKSGYDSVGNGTVSNTIDMLNQRINTLYMVDRLSNRDMKSIYQLGSILKSLVQSEGETTFALGKTITSQRIGSGVSDFAQRMSTKGGFAKTFDVIGGRPYVTQPVYMRHLFGSESFVSETYLNAIRKISEGQGHAQRVSMSLFKSACVKHNVSPSTFNANLNKTMIEIPNIAYVNGKIVQQGTIRVTANEAASFYSTLYDERAPVQMMRTGIHEFTSQKTGALGKSNVNRMYIGLRGTEAKNRSKLISDYKSAVNAESKKSAKILLDQHRQKFGLTTEEIYSDYKSANEAIKKAKLSISNYRLKLTDKSITPKQREVAKKGLQKAKDKYVEASSRLQNNSIQKQDVLDFYKKNLEEQMTPEMRVQYDMFYGFNSYYSDSISNKFKNIYGFEMPLDPKHFPMSRVTQNLQSSDVRPTQSIFHTPFLKPSPGGAGTLKYQPSTELYKRYAQNVGAWTESADDMYMLEVLKNSTAIRDVFIENNMNSAYKQFIKSITNLGSTPDMTVTHRVLNQYIGKLMGVQVSDLNISIPANQLTSIPSFMSTGLDAKYLFNPKNYNPKYIARNAMELMQDDFYFNRYYMGKSSLQTSVFADTSSAGTYYTGKINGLTSIRTADLIANAQGYGGWKLHYASKLGFDISHPLVKENAMRSVKLGTELTQPMWDSAVYASWISEVGVLKNLYLPYRTAYDAINSALVDNALQHGVWSKEFASSAAGAIISHFAYGFTSTAGASVKSLIRDTVAREVLGVPSVEKSPVADIDRFKDTMLDSLKKVWIGGEFLYEIGEFAYNSTQGLPTTHREILSNNMAQEFLEMAIMSPVDAIAETKRMLELAKQWEVDKAHVYDTKTGKFNIINSEGVIVKEGVTAAELSIISSVPLTEIAAATDSQYKAVRFFRLISTVGSSFAMFAGHPSAAYALNEVSRILDIPAENMNIDLPVSKQREFTLKYNNLPEKVRTLKDKLDEKTIGEVTRQKDWDASQIENALDVSFNAAVKFFSSDINQISSQISAFALAEKEQREARDAQAADEMAEKVEKLRSALPKLILAFDNILDQYEAFSDGRIDDAPNLILKKGKTSRGATRYTVEVKSEGLNLEQIKTTPPTIEGID